MENIAESQAASFFQAGRYAEAQQIYTTCLENNGKSKDSKINLLLDRSACYLKLKQLDNVVKDCNAVLNLDKNNQKAHSRKVKALCSLGRFQNAHETAEQWLIQDPESLQAKKEVDRLGIILQALHDQDGEDEIVVSSGGETNSTSKKSKTDPVTNGISQENTTETNKNNENGNSFQSQNNNSNLSQDVSNESNGKAHKNAKKQGKGQDRQKQNSTGDKEDILSDVKEPYPCSQCSISFKTENELAIHCAGDLHKKMAVGSDEGKEWKYRTPPRGLTSDEYTTCPRFLKEGTCRIGENCSLAHSEEELKEWKERFEFHKQTIKKAKETDQQNSPYAEQLMEKVLNAENPESVMTETLEHVNVHVGSDTSVAMSSKRCSQSWTFTLTSKTSMRRVAVLDDATRKYYHIASITVGPKRQQKVQTIEELCQEWNNADYVIGKFSQEKVYRIKVSFKTDIYGTFRQSIAFDFGSEPVLVKQLCVDSTPVVELEKMANFIVDEGGRWDLSTKQIIEFEPKLDSTDSAEKSLLVKYPPPMAAKFAMSEAILEPELSMESYKTRMHDLLYIEEMAQFSSIAKYNVKAPLQLVSRFMLMPSTVSTAKFAQNGELFARMQLDSEISEDTAHGRLILQNVHTVYLAPYDPKKENEPPPKLVYEATVEDKGKKFIFLRLSSRVVSQYNLRPDMDFHAEVQFHLNRLPICEMHAAIDWLGDTSLVFPDPSVPNIPWSPRNLDEQGVKGPASITNITRQWGEKLDARLNAKQKEAILAITAPLEHRLPPVLIVGPYGTGKTFTLAQAAKEILKQPDTRVLICTHSNSAADLYIKEYFHPYVEEGHTEATPVRIYYRQRWLQTVNPTVLQYCLLTHESYGSSFRMPKKSDIEDKRAVVCTLSTSRYIYNLGLERGFFTHILLDEAAQAQECETIMPLSLANSLTRIVLAGDHMQLSPEVYSDFARDKRLDVSFLERMYDLYQKENPCKILLCENYRSHKAIIDYTSELFYDNQLLASGQQPRHEIFYPLTFFTAKGEDVQHQNSTTFYNNAEVYEIVERVSELQKMWPKAWGPQDDASIGVVSPYADQVVRIRAELRKKKLFNVSVERVFNVQGKQFRAIFLSTVRTRHTCSADSSMEDYMDYGFLSNVKLLNTAITRAQSLVAVVGDPVALCSIGKCRKLWERFVTICNKCNSLYGITWSHIKAQLDGVEMKKTYILNPLAPEFVPNRLRHAPYQPPEPVAFGKFGYTFSQPPQGWNRHTRFLTPNPFYQMMPVPYLGVVPRVPPGAIRTQGLPSVSGTQTSHSNSSPIKVPISSGTTPSESKVESPKNNDSKMSNVGAVTLHSPKKAGESPSVTSTSGMAITKPMPIPQPAYPYPPNSGPMYLPPPSHPAFPHQRMMYPPGSFVGGYQPGMIYHPSGAPMMIGPRGMSPHVNPQFAHMSPPGASYATPLIPPGAQRVSMSMGGPGSHGVPPLSLPGPGMSSSGLGSASSASQLSPTLSSISTNSSHIGAQQNSLNGNMPYKHSNEAMYAMKGKGYSNPERPSPQIQILPNVRNVGSADDNKPMTKPPWQRSPKQNGASQANNERDQPQKDPYSFIVKSEPSPTSPYVHKPGNKVNTQNPERSSREDDIIARFLQKGYSQRDPPPRPPQEMFRHGKQPPGKMGAVTVSVNSEESGRNPNHQESQGLMFSNLQSEFPELSEHTRKFAVPGGDRSGNIQNWGPPINQAVAMEQNLSGNRNVVGAYPDNQHSAQHPPTGLLMPGDSANGLELPTAVDHMVRFIEESMDDSLESEYTCRKPTTEGGAQSGPNQRQVPLYMRGSRTGTQPTMSYAGALRSTPTPTPIPPNLLSQGPISPSGGAESLKSQGSDSEEIVGDPLDLLKNLNIKASPGTQAFYQYFS